MAESFVLKCIGWWKYLLVEDLITFLTVLSSTHELRGSHWRDNKLWENVKLTCMLHQPHPSEEPLPAFFACRQVASTVHQMEAQRSFSLFSFMPSLWFTVCPACKVRQQGGGGSLLLQSEEFCNSWKLQKIIKECSITYTLRITSSCGGKTEPQNTYFCPAYLAGCYAQ